MPLPASNRSKSGKRANAKFVMGEFKSGALHSGSNKGPVVTNRKQAVAIMLSETGQSKGQQSTRHAKTMPQGRGRTTSA